MKTRLLYWNKIKLVFAFLVIGFSFSQKCFSQGDIYPLSENSFTGAGSICQNSVAPDLVYSLNTVTCGTTPFSAVDITVTWFSNSTNSTSGGTQVSQVNSTSATTTFNYTPSTVVTGTLYYYVEISWGAGFSCAPAGTFASSETQEVIVNSPLPVSANISATATTICAGTSVTFTATPTNGGGSPSYQWKVNGFNAGTNSNTFTTIVCIKNK